MKNLNSSPSKLISTSVAILFIGFVSPLSAQVVFENGGGDNVWGNPLNWSDGELPLVTDVVNLGTFTVEVNAPGATYLTPTASTGATVNINNGGVLTPGTNAFNSLRNIGPININSGGTLEGGSLVARTDITVNTGGLLNGVGAIRDGSEIVLDGGVWAPSPPSSSTYNIRIDSANTAFDLSTGKLQLDLISAGSFEKFDFISASTTYFNFNTSGTIEIIDGYGVELDDTFSFVVISGAGTPVIDYGSGSNVVLVGAAPGLSLDVSQWATNGTVTVVPEPTTSLLLAAGGLITMVFRRRRSA